MKILIIGAGEIGKALNTILQSKADINIWDIDPQKMPKPVDINSAILESAIIFLCVPSWANRDTAKRIAETHPQQNPIVLSLSKGLEKSTGKLMSEVLKEELYSGRGSSDNNLLLYKEGKGRSNNIAYGILSGPMIAEDLMAGKSCKAVVALSNRSARHLGGGPPPTGGWDSSEVKEVSTDRIIANLFADTSIRIIFSDDLSGVSACGPLKNIYSIGLGIADGTNASQDRDTQLSRHLGGGSSPTGGWDSSEVKEVSESYHRTQIINTAVSEMKKLVRVFGGQSETVDTPAGRDDLIATGSSQNSANYMIGYNFAKSQLARHLGGGPPPTSEWDSSEVKGVSESCDFSPTEGTISLEELHRKIGADLNNFPLARAIYDIVFNNQDPTIISGVVKR